eukprot:5293900-Amphidinium_carterae.1
MPLMSGPPRAPASLGPIVLSGCQLGREKYVGVRRRLRHALQHVALVIFALRSLAILGLDPCLAVILLPHTVLLFQVLDSVWCHLPTMLEPYTSKHGFWSVKALRR